MTAVRRLYVYLVAFAALGALATGLANLLRALLEVWLQTAAAITPGYLQDQVALWGAAILVGLPMWGLHWTWAQRRRAEAVERRSTLRRLYVYAVLASAALIAAAALDEALSGAARAFAGDPAHLTRTVIPPLPLVGVAAVVWAYHWGIAGADREAVGERGGAATLRRWSIYGVAFVGFVLVLSGAQQVLQSTWLLLTNPALGHAGTIPGFADLLVGLALWYLYWGWAPGAQGCKVQDEDRRATLRSVYLFLALAVALTGTLVGISQALYYALGRLLGIAEPGGVGGRLVDAAAGPLSVATIYGVGWWYQRQAIAREVAHAEVPRQVGVRRLYESLAALVALAVFAIGLGGLLWVLGDLATRSAPLLAAGWWRDRVALFATLTVVGLPVWLLHWYPGRVADAGSLARRIYLYLILIGSTLTLLGSGVVAGYRLLSLVLGTSTPEEARTDLAHALAVALVAAGVSAYHWRAVQEDARAARATVVAPAPVQAVVALEAPSAAALDSALDTLRAQGVTVHRRAT
jgi:hypothetical protein